MWGGRFRSCPRTTQKLPLSGTHQIHARYGWTIGVPDNGNEWRQFCTRTPCVPLFCTLSEGLVDFQGSVGMLSIVWRNVRPVIFPVDQTQCTLGQVLRSLRQSPRSFSGCSIGPKVRPAVHELKGGKDPHPQNFSLTRKTARFTKGRFRPY